LFELVESCPASSEVVDPPVSSDQETPDSPQPEKPTEVLISKTVLFDWEKALSQVGGTKEILVDLIQLFGEEAPKLSKAIRIAVEEKNMAEVRRNAHTLKGSARIFSAEPLVDAAARIEMMGKDQDLSEIDDALISLDVEIDRLLPALDHKVCHGADK